MGKETIKLEMISCPGNIGHPFSGDCGPTFGTCSVSNVVGFVDQVWLSMNDGLGSDHEHVGPLHRIAAHKIPHY